MSSARSPGEAHTAARPLTAYGGFVLGEMQLALPMSALREVVPLEGLQRLPCPAVGVIGGIDLRGVTVPVLDLRRVLGCAEVALPHPAVIIMVHEGHLLGLRADGVTGIFHAATADLHAMQVDDAVAAVFAGSIRREGETAMVSVLAPAALAALPQVPRVADPEPARQPLADDGETPVLNDTTRHVLLVRAGVVHLAIDAMAVHATLSDPTLVRTVLTRGSCRGAIDHAGAMVPALDVLAVSGLGTLAADAPRQAFVLRLSEGMVAFLVDEVVDVVRVPADAVLRLAAFAMPRGRLFAGTLPASALPADVQARLPQAGAQFFLLDSEALGAEDEVHSMAATNTPGSRSADGPATACAGLGGQGLRQMVTYTLAAETATPMTQVQEILPFNNEIALLGNEGPLLGLLVNRGRSIPVLCLNRLVGGASVAGTPLGSVLVVASEGELVGFAVQALKAIEPSDWEPELPPMGRQRGDALNQALQSRRLAQIGSGGQERMLPVLDLQRIAQGLQAQHRHAA